MIKRLHGLVSVPVHTEKSASYLNEYIVVIWKYNIKGVLFERISLKKESTSSKTLLSININKYYIKIKTHPVKLIYYAIIRLNQNR